MTRQCTNFRCGITNLIRIVAHLYQRPTPLQIPCDSAQHFVVTHTDLSVLSVTCRWMALLLSLSDNCYIVCLSPRLLMVSHGVELSMVGNLRLVRFMIA